MNTIKIIADSTCDLPADILKKYDIDIIPLCINTDNTIYRDGIDITPADIFAWSDKVKKVPQTSSPLLQEAIDLIKPYIEQERFILFFGISGTMSSTCSVLQLAANYYDYIHFHVIDSMNLSNGIGLQVIKAAELALEGNTPEQIIEFIEQDLRGRIRSSFIVDTLTYLARGGRCSTATALIGNTLNLKPVIVVKNGKMDVGRKYRAGKRSSYDSYVNDLKNDLIDADPERIFLIHADCAKETVDSIYGFLSNLGIFKEILVTQAGGVISSHCGPKTLGIMYAAK